MKHLLLALFALLFVPLSAMGQLSGPKTIPGDYATLSAAITDLNAQGVGAGGVTFNVAAGYTELLTGRLAVTATGTAANPIVFQKSGAGANPLLTAYAGTATPGSASPDGIWSFEGSDYVTVDGIDLTDPNAANPATMEYGFGLFKASATDGAQFNTIKNCVITLNRENNATGTSPMVEGSVGILVINSTPGVATTAITPTAASGTNSSNKVYTNTIQNCNYGVVLSGYAAATPFTLGDTGNDIGGTSLGTGNSILNFGGAAAATNPAAGVRANNQWGVNISYNTINNNNGSGVNHVSTLRGIYGQAGTSASATINNNTVTVKSGATTSQLSLIENSIGSTAAGNTVNINNNILSGEYLTATSGACYGIYNTASAAAVNITTNNLSGINYSSAALTGTGAVYGIYNTGATPSLNVRSNTVTNISRTGTTGGTTIGIYASSGTNQTVKSNSVNNLSIDGTGTTSTMYGIQTSTGTIVVDSNNVNALSCIKATGTGSLYGIYNISSPTNENFNYNQVYNLTHAGTGTTYGIYTFTATGTRTVSNNLVHSITTAGTTVAGINQSSSSPNVFKNKIYNIQSTSAGAPTVAGIGLTSVGTSGTANIYNNLIGDLKAPNAVTSAATAPSVRGINITSTTATSTVNISYNSVYLNAASAGANFGTTGLFVTTSATATSAALSLRNNVIVNLSTPAGTGLAVAFQRSSVALDNYAAASNNNLFYAGTPGAANLVFYDGTNLDQTLAAFKARVSPREALSTTELPPFLSTTGSDATFLHMNTGIATRTESGGTPIAGITDDYDSNTRHAGNPDIGADEFAGIGIDELGPNIVYTPLLNTGTTSARTLVAMLTDPSGVPTAGIGLPVLSWRINGGSYSTATATSLGGNQYQFSFGAGVVTGDTVRYFIVAQDGALTPNVGAQPSGGASGFTANPPAAATPPTSPSSYIITNASLSGDYTVGLALFNRVTGKNVTFQKSVRKVMKEVVVEVPVQIQPEEKGTLGAEAPVSVSHEITGKKELVEVEEISWIPVENGKEYTGDLYVKRNEHPNLNWPSGVLAVYSTITAAVADLNLRGTSGHTNFLLVDAAYPTETFPIIVNVTNANKPAASSTVTFKPSTGVTATISGTVASGHLFRILSSYVNFDGSNSGGATRDLTISNLSTTSPQVMVIGSTGTTPITNCSVKNCVIINGANTSSALIVSDGAAAATAGWFNNITIQNNSIQRAYVANYNIAVVAPGNGSGLLVTGNDFATSGANSVRLVAAYVQGVDGATVSNNTIGNIVNTADASNITGVWFATGTVNSKISGNVISTISGTASAPRGIAVSSGVVASNDTVIGNTISGLTSSSTGTTTGINVFSTTEGVVVRNNVVSNVKNTNTGGWGANGIQLATTSATANVTVVNNVVFDIAAYGFAGSGIADNGYGIIITGGAGYKLYYNSVHLNTSQTVNGWPAAINVTSGVTLAGAIDMRDNIFANSQTVDTNRYAIYSGAPNTVYSQINYNDYFSSGPNLGFLGTNQANIAAWRVATGQDVNSISGDPLFVGSTDLRPYIGSPVLGAGVGIVGFTTDILGVTRGTPPTLGAYENSVAAAMTYTSSTATQNVLNNVYIGSSDQQIVGIQVVTTGTVSPISATRFRLGTDGSTSASDIANAKLFYTGTSSVFGTATQFGSTVVSPNGAFTIDGSQTLAAGTNYFWLTYSISPSAAHGDSVDAQCDSVYVGAGGYIPTVTAPAGKRRITGVAVMVATPDSVLKTQATNTTTTDTVKIKNSGNGPLTWSIADENARPEVGPMQFFVAGPELPKGVDDGTSSGPITDGQGGPDAFGYKWIDSDEPGGPVFNWIDISGSGTMLDSNSAWVPTGTFSRWDEGYYGVQLPFSFNYYGVAKDSLFIGTNGNVMFQRPTGNIFTNAAFPTAGGLIDNHIGVCWDDQMIRVPGKVYYGMSGSDFVVQFDSIPLYSTTVWPPNNTFEVILSPNGTIKTQYKNMGISGGSLTAAAIGMENATGTVGLGVVNNAAYMHNNLAIRFALPDAPWLSESPTSGTVNPGDSVKVVLTFNSTGLSDSTYRAVLKIASNDTLNPTKDIPVRMTVGSTTTTLNVAIANGWNLISNPVTNPIPGDSVRQLYPTSVNAYAFEFSSGYVQRYILVNGKGYWEKFPAAIANSITGTARTRDSISVVAGWNIVGTISNPVDTSTIVSVPPGLRTSSWFGYAAGYTAVTQLVPGKGYWVKSSAAGKFVLANPLVAKPAQGRESGVDVAQVLNSLTITDSKGGSQTLYFGADGQKQIPLAPYAMPPVPPVGAFDARFESVEGGSMVQTHDAEVSAPVEFAVTVQSDSYPLTVSWKVVNATYALTDGEGNSKDMTGEGSMQITNSSVNRFSVQLLGNGQLPKEFSLSQNYPNPFNPTTNIKYALPVDSRVTVDVYNVIGQRVSSLVNDNQAAGYHAIEWNGTGNAGQQLSSGVYFLHLSAKGTNGVSFSEIRKLMLLK